MTSFPVCVVCNVPFKYRGPQPHLLPCLHAACSICIDSDVESPVSCSVCQRSHTRSKQTFPVDQVVLADVLHLTSQQQPSEISCTNKEDGNQAVCWCEECNDFLCEHCHISHAEVKITRNHKVWEISDVSKTFKIFQTICIKHGLPMKIYDKDCDHFICSQCFYTDHTNHSTITSDEFARMEEQNLKENVKSVSEKRNTVLSSMANVNTHAKIVEDTSSRLRETVEHTFSELRSLINQREKMVLVELEQLTECMRTSNNNRLPVLKSVDNSCQTTLDYINKCLLYTSPQHLLQLKSSIGEATQFCNNSDVPQVHKDESSVAFCKQGLQDVRSAISSFGSFLAPVVQTGQPDEFTSFQTYKQKSLEATNEGLEKQMRETIKTTEFLKEKVSSGKRKIQELTGTNARLQKVISQIDPDGLTKDGSLHIIKSLNNKMFVVKSPKMIFDDAKVNQIRAHKDEHGALVSGGKWRETCLNQLKNYWGTTTTSSLPADGLVYWEVEADVDMGCGLEERTLILEVAVCDEAVMDKSHCVSRQANSCSLYLVQGDGGYNDMIYLRLAEDGHVVDNKQLLKRIETVHRLKFGVLYDGRAHKVTFFAAKDMKIIGRTCSWGTSTTVWPMFGVFPVTKKMELISGMDIDMSQTKKMALLKALDV